MNVVTRGLGATHDNLVTGGLGFAGDPPIIFRKLKAYIVSMTRTHEEEVQK